MKRKEMDKIENRENKGKESEGKEKEVMQGTEIENQKLNSVGGRQTDKCIWTVLMKQNEMDIIEWRK